MPRPGPRRTVVSTRLADDELAAVEAVARTEIPLKGEDEPNLSEALRKLTQEALAARGLEVEL